ncbi:MAG TPA: uroporphyrinogen-III synthase [Prolixibacteraceae bacterium]|nr:uroporphyrinogen-III synthase [Bacteroidales bacterium]HQN92524.1 uroporphyrinogen-III synthase [Prolixibacteraceae bacterium]HUM88778.1 uroporphyrinogen-III synthase [Prolixibacteraceae bacterium]
MKIKRILVSQPEPTSVKSPYHEFAERNNVKVDFRSFTEVEGVSAKEYRQTRVSILDHTAVIFTGRTAIDHFFRICADLRIVVPETMKYFCMSEATAFYLQKYIVYRKRKIFYSDGPFSDLLEIMKKHLDETYLLPLSHVHNQDIPQLLDEAKVKYSKAILYRTVSSDLSDLKNVNYDILVFYSPSGIKSLLQNFPDFQQNDIKIASFGASTAEAVKEAGLRLDIQAPNPEAPSMTMALEQYIKKVNKVK